MRSIAEEQAIKAIHRSQDQRAAGFVVTLGLLALFFYAAAARADSRFLPVNQAFAPSVSRMDAARVAITWRIADGYYLYRHAFDFELVRAGGARAAAAELPTGDRHRDEFFGEVETYRHRLRAVVPIHDAGKLAGGAAIRISYQGCADAGLCYPPQTRTLAIPDASTDPAAAGRPPPQPIAPPSAAQARAVANRPEQAALADRLARAGPVSTLALFFGLGVLLAFTPCVLPMIPIVAALVVGSRAAPARAFALSAVYVLAMAAAYTVFGVVAASFGANLQALLQTPTVLFAFAAVFVVLALASFGWFEIAVPSTWRQRLERVGRHRRGGFVGAGLMGFFAALIAGPCLAPPLVGALLYISSTGDAALGGAALFVLGLGMGLPLIAIAVFGARVLPRSGPWTDQIRIFFGVVLLGIAWWLAARLAAPTTALTGWGTLALGYGAYLSTRAPRARGMLMLTRAVVFALWLYAACAGVGLAVGDGRPARPLAGLNGFAVSASDHDETTHASPFTRVSDLEILRRRLAEAARAERPAVIDFYADWCVECVRMERDVFARPAVRRALSRVVAIQVDVTAYDASDRALMRRLGVFGPPAVLFFRADGREARDQRLVGLTDARGFLARLRRANAAADTAS